ncbi:Na(+)/H(+) exchanger beta-like [Penaeus indicus]|uniref:Na(+)/H(+) exchanger beta-like n=1 Tax=Penaeus indicus TaxID=29960 RepID=UPI00300D7858
MALMESKSSSYSYDSISTRCSLHSCFDRITVSQKINEVPFAQHKNRPFGVEIKSEPVAGILPLDLLNITQYPPAVFPSRCRNITHCRSVTAFHQIHWLSNKIPESCVLIILGVLLGIVVFFTVDDGNGTSSCSYNFEVPHFTSDKFFFVLLPPIILESAYSLHDRAFFDNLGTVLVFAVIGTLFNIFTIGPALYGVAQGGLMGAIAIGFTETLVFSSLISAVDPVAVLAIFQELGVNKDLYFLVFGESLLNDGVTIVVYTTLTSFVTMEVISAGQYALAVASFFIVVFAGAIIGILFGCVTALITKYTAEVRVVEPLALLGLAYLCYLTAELFHFSGIISLIMCGLFQANYAFQNISQKSYTCVKYFTKMASATSDTIIFMFLGMALVSKDHIWHPGFILWTIGFCLIFRFIGVALLTIVMNHYRMKKIGLQEQFITAYGGLRGAVAFSLANMLDQTVDPRRIFITTTLMVILFTGFIQGISIKPLVNLLRIQKKRSDHKKLNEEINDTAMDHIMAGVEEILGQHGDFYLRELIIHYNDKYLKKWFVKPCSESKLTRLFEKIAISEHYAHLYGPVAMIEDKVKPLVTKSAASKRIRTISVSPSHNDEILLQPNLSLEDEEDDEFEEEENKVIQPAEPVELRRKPTYLPIRRSRVASESSVTEPQVQRSHDAQTLRKAFRNNPYNKLHYKYNPNLVGEEDQELAEHLHRRHLNARRMTRLASCSRLPVSNIVESLRPKTEINFGHLEDGVAELVQRHHERRSTMSLRRRPYPLQACFSSPEPGNPMASPTILRDLREASEPRSSLPDIRDHDSHSRHSASASMRGEQQRLFPDRSESEGTANPEVTYRNEKSNEEVPMVATSTNMQPSSPKKPDSENEDVV